MIVEMKITGKTKKLVEGLDILHESKRKFHIMIEQSNYVAVSMDEQNLIQYVNNVIEAMTGFGPSELVGTSFKV
jgi:PAS domain S-box-containing protein